MRLYSIIIYKDSSLMYKNFNLEEFYFFTRPKIEQSILEISNAINKKIHDDKFYQVTEVVNDMTFYIYVYAIAGRIFIALTDQDYPTSITLQFLREIYDSDIELYDSIWLKYQDPAKINNIIKF